MTSLYPTENISELNAQHERVYDQLAGEYDDRAETLRPITQQAIDWLLSYDVPANGHALDVGCGAGMTTRVLTDAGYQVTAVDLSAPMVAATQKRTPDAIGVVGDYLDLAFPQSFDAMVAFAYIHLFPARVAAAHLRKMGSELSPDGRLLIGTTQSDRSSEGWERKADYGPAAQRYRKHWTEQEFRIALRSTGFDLLDLTVHKDPFGKSWMDAIVRYPQR